MAELKNLFQDKTVLLLGGGPSLLDLIGDVEEKLPLSRDYGMIAINDAVYLSIYSDVLFFRDISWFFANRNIAHMWNGIVVSSTPCQFYPRNVNVIETTHCNDFLIGGDRIRYGRSSGHLALSLAINLGAKACVLLGYDCRVVDGRSHFHDKHSNAFEMTYSHDFLPAWQGWGDAARRAGVEVWNGTPDSAIQEFPFRSLNEIFS
jgi:hypothetical protein